VRLMWQEPRISAEVWYLSNLLSREGLCWRDSRCKKGILVMTMSDPIADFLTRLRNASLAGKAQVRAPQSKLLKKLAEIFKKEGFVESVKVEESELVVKLNPVKPFGSLRRLSKPGVRYYTNAARIPSPRSGYGFVILSTPKGLLTGHQARKQKVGGELLCEVW